MSGYRRYGGIIYTAVESMEKASLGERNCGGYVSSGSITSQGTAEEALAEDRRRRAILKLSEANDASRHHASRDD